jgi:DNA-binding transcriptional ArsR family regulator
VAVGTRPARPWRVSCGAGGFRGAHVYAVCLEKLDGKTAVEPASLAVLRTCLMCERIVRFLVKADCGEHTEWPKPADLRAEYEAGATVPQLGMRHQIGYLRTRYLLEVAKTPMRPSTSEATETADAERANAVLGLFAEEPDLEMCGVDIARELDLEPKAVYRTLRRLAQAGVLTRLEPERGHSRPYRLTDAGS